MISQVLESKIAKALLVFDDKDSRGQSLVHNYELSSQCDLKPAASSGQSSL